MNGQFFQQPAIVSAIVAGAVGLLTVSLNAVVTSILHGVRIRADKDITKYKARLDRDLRRADFAEDVLAGFYEASRNLVHIRSPASFSSENDDRQGREAEDDRERQRKDAYYPTIKRLNDYNSFFSAFFAKRYRAKALFGEAASQAFDDIWSVIISIQVSVGFLIREGGNELIPMSTIEHQHDVIWSGYGERDETGLKIESAVLAAENLFGPILRSL